MPQGGRLVDVPEIVVCSDPAGVIDQAVRLLVEAAGASIAERGRFAIALAGGSTPRPLYERLAALPARGGIDWRKVELFWSDERCVPPDDEHSNHRLARETLLDHVPVAAERIHRMRGEDPDAERAAAEYERVLRWALGGSSGRPPRLDLVLLGLGPEGHIASLFPGSRAIFESERLVAAVRHAGDPEPRLDRLTLTPPAINAAREVVFLVSGSEKAGAVRASLEGPRDPERWPAQTIAPVEGRETWVVDRAAAAELSRPTRTAAGSP
jgi:6-phosphogluconolactonase